MESKLTNNEYCPKCESQVNTYSRVEMYHHDKKANPEFYFICDKCFMRIEKFLRKTDSKLDFFDRRNRKNDSF